MTAIRPLFFLVKKGVDLVIVSKEEKNKKRKEFEHLKRIGVFKLKGECSICRNKEETCFHHIVPLSTSKGTNSVNNVIEVCYECHKDIHESLKLISGPLTESQKKVISEANKKEMILKYNFTSIDPNIYGNKSCKGNKELIDSINAIILEVKNKGYNMRWSKTGKSDFATAGARKTINSQLEKYNDEYKICRRKYSNGFIDIYIPVKRGA